MRDRKPLPPIPFTREPNTPLPDVVELPPDEGWAQWDAAKLAADAAAGLRIPTTKKEPA